MTSYENERIKRATNKRTSKPNQATNTHAHTHTHTHKHTHPLATHAQAWLMQTKLTHGKPKERTESTATETSSATATI